MGGNRVLRGFGCAGYRSLSSKQIQRIGPLNKIHLLAGPNNAGKSNVLRATQLFLPSLYPKATSLYVAELDRSPSTEESFRQVVRIAIAHKIAAADIEQLAARSDPTSAESLTAEMLWKLVEHSALKPDADGLSWFELEIRDLTPLTGADAAPFVHEAVRAGGRLRGILAPGAGSMSRKEIDALGATAKAAGAGGLIWARRTAAGWARAARCRSR